MKKIIFGLVALASMSLTLVSCGGDDIEVDRGTHAQLPEQAAAGTYAGTWYAADDDAFSTGLTSEEGTVVFTPGEVAYTVNVTTNFPSNAAACGTTIANIMWKNNDFNFGNANAVGTLATPLNGVIQDNVMTMMFFKSYKEGRKTIVKFFRFEGVKQ